jgi:putative endonuclease
MHYVYFIRSLQDATKTYVGYTTSVEQRLETHNSGRSVHTKRYMPWTLIAYVAFNSEAKAREFERYVKVGSGHAFAKKKF